MKLRYCILISALLVLSFASTASAQKLDVKIVDRQESETGYTYLVPGHFSSQSNSNVNCYDDATCNQTTTVSGTITQAQRISYEVRGATFTLLLPDGRGAVVNCESKYEPKGDYINRRNCRVPLVDDIQAEFHGDKAKLVWVVSLDAKKTQSETYKVLAILNKPPNSDGQRVQSPTYSETIPAGATAQCRDGSYGFSQHRQGTCSHHGGVARWLDK
jgi:hypothetical protein